MNRAIGLLILVIIFALSCAGPIVPIDFPAGDFEPNEFCIDFEQSSAEGAVNRANAALLYGDLGIYMPSNPVITNNSALCNGFQCLYQGDLGAARPAASCGPLEIQIHPDLLAGKVKFEARNVGFISTPVEIVATAFGEGEGAEVEVDQYRKVSLSRLGDLEPVEIVTVESLDTDTTSEPAITKVIVDYGTCPPHVVIDNLCITPKERQTRTVGQSDAGADRLVYYFDHRDRKSYIQLANLSNSAVEVHVQVWIANSTIAECEEIDFIDTYSAKDVHTYNMMDLIRNSGPPLSFAPGTLSGKYGFVVISKSTGPRDALVGTMRIIDNAGYEYKTNAVAPESNSINSNMFGAINFNNVNGTSSSELIGFTYSEIPSLDTVIAGGVSTVFGDATGATLILGNFVDEDEGGTGAEYVFTCSPTVFSCTDSATNIGIDRSLPNSKNPDGPVACSTSIIGANSDSGGLYLPHHSTVCTNPILRDAEGNCMYDTHFVGFTGLNNGSSSGTFDSWWGGEIIDAE